MSGRPRTTSFAEGNKQSLNPPLGGLKISSKLHACSVVRPARVTSPLGERTPRAALLALPIAYNMAATDIIERADMPQSPPDTCPNFAGTRRCRPFPPPARPPPPRSIPPESQKREKNIEPASSCVNCHK